jgi:hypothetical protein
LLPGIDHFDRGGAQPFARLDQQLRRVEESGLFEENRGEATGRGGKVAAIERDLRERVARLQRRAACLPLLNRLARFAGNGKILSRRAYGLGGARGARPRTPASR